MSDHTASKPSLPRRRNGNIAACEPCRKSKAKCDHAYPTCSRCRKRKTPAQCIFLNAPMTQTKPTRATSSQIVSPPPTQLTSPASRVELCHLHPPNEPSPISQTHGFLGSTSFTATMCIHDEKLTEEDVKGLNFKDTLGDGYQNGTIDSGYFQLGLKVLRQLPNEKACHDLLDYYHSGKVTEMVYQSQTSVKFCLEALWSTFGNDLRKAEIRFVAHLIFRNASRPVKLEGLDEPTEWMEPFAGLSTRWETIGTFFVAFTYALLSFPEEEIFACFGRKADERQALIAEMKGCVEACIELCRSSLNMLVCHVLYKNMLLETIIRGDASLSAWRLHNDLIGTAVAYGLHCYQGTTKVTVQSEMKKRLSACIFWSDKELSMFTGRPPSLSRRYYSCPLPLDVDDEALAAGGELLEAEINSLDENGWNTQGRVFESTLCRILVLCALIQDEILELFIGNQAQWSNDRLEDIKSRTLEMYAKSPVPLQVSKQDFMDCPDDKTMWRLLCGRLDYLRVHLLLERLATERGGASKQELFAVARELLELTVFLWVQRDRSSTLVHHYDYMIMSYGMPSIGILCTELLRQVKHPEKIEVKLPVSEIVQNLSLMISFLEWIRPTAGNYKLCRPLSRVIRRVLDQLFEPTSGEVEVSSNDDRQQESRFEGHSWPLDSMDDLEWLNSIDWTLGQYMDLN